MNLALSRVLTISVDDGHPEDFRCADLLSKYGLKATFYVPRENPERSVINEDQIRALASQFEVGAHSLSHLPLTQLGDDQAWNEIHGSKVWLEEVLGRPVDSFCYPRGKFNRKLLEMVRRAGYLGARTCLQNLTSHPMDPCLAGASTQAYSHSRLIQIRHALLEGNFAGAIQFFTVFKGKVDWEEHFTRALDRVSDQGGVAHLYFHGWEIEQMGEWDKLERVLRRASRESSLTCMTNGEYFRLLSARKVPQAGTADPL